MSQIVALPYSPGTLSRITECGLRMSTYSISPLIAKSATFRVERDRRVMREADE
ncbi:MAG TPA: hypothetical protein VIQ99_04320 [Gammaproteobacteria bacterium]